MDTNNLTPAQKQILHDYSESCRVRHLLGDGRPGAHFALMEPETWRQNVQDSALRGIAAGRETWERITEVARKHRDSQRPAMWPVHNSVLDRARRHPMGLGTTRDPLDSAAALMVQDCDINNMPAWWGTSAWYGDAPSPGEIQPHPDTARLDFLLRFIRIDGVGDSDPTLKGVVIKCEEISDAIGFGPIKDNDADRLIKEWDDNLRTVIDRAIAAHGFAGKEAAK